MDFEFDIARLTLDDGGNTSNATESNASMAPSPSRSVADLCQDTPYGAERTKTTFTGMEKPFVPASMKTAQQANVPSAGGNVMGGTPTGGSMTGSMTGGNGISSDFGGMMGGNARNPSPYQQNTAAAPASAPSGGSAQTPSIWALMPDGNVVSISQVAQPPMQSPYFNPQPIQSEVKYFASTQDGQNVQPLTLAMLL